MDRECESQASGLAVPVYAAPSDERVADSRTAAPRVAAPGVPDPRVADHTDQPGSDPLAGNVAEGHADALVGTQAIAGALAAGRGRAAEADAALGVASGHVRTVVAALVGVESAVARGEGLVATLARLARQTQRTALNASIEAARVGEEGRAFGVVAESLRRLAEEAAGAARTAAAEMADARDDATRAATEVQRAAGALERARGLTQELTITLGDLWEEADGAEDAVADGEDALAAPGSPGRTPR